MKTRLLLVLVIGLLSTLSAAASVSDQVQVIGDSRGFAFKICVGTPNSVTHRPDPVALTREGNHLSLTYSVTSCCLLGIGDHFEIFEFPPLPDGNYEYTVRVMVDRQLVTFSGSFATEELRPRFPALHAETTADNAVQVWWDEVNFPLPEFVRLETSIDPSDPESWEVATGGRYIARGRWAVTFPLAEAPQRFFRLVQAVTKIELDEEAVNG